MAEEKTGKGLTTREQIYQDLRMEWARKTQKVILEGHEKKYPSTVAKPINLSLIGVLNKLYDGFSLYSTVRKIENGTLTVEDFIKATIKEATKKKILGV